VSTWVPAGLAEAPPGGASKRAKRRRFLERVQRRRAQGGRHEREAVDVSPRRPPEEACHLPEQGQRREEEWRQRELWI
jgi:hypothetical protein